MRAGSSTASIFMGAALMSICPETAPERLQPGVRVGDTLLGKETYLICQGIGEVSHIAVERSRATTTST